MNKNSLKIALTFVGTILGAGFATGKELVSFFACFDKMGILAFFISCIFFTLVSIVVLMAIYIKKDTTYNQFVNQVFGKFGSFVEYFNISMLFILFSAMLAGGGATLSSIFNIDEVIGIVVFAIATFFAISYGKNAIIAVNMCLTPILIVGGMLIGIYLHFFKVQSVFNEYSKIVTSPVVYTSYNTITTISVLFAIKNSIKDKKTVVFSSIISGVLIFIIGIFMLLPLIENYSLIYNNSLPILKLVQDEKIIKYIFTLTVLAAIFTTSVSNATALENIFIEKYNLNINNTKAIIMLLGVFFSMIGFSNIVNIVYPIFGIIGTFEIGFIIVFLFKYIDK